MIDDLEIRLININELSKIKKRIEFIEKTALDYVKSSNSKALMRSTFNNPMTICYSLEHNGQTVGHIIASPLESFYLVDFVGEDPEFCKNSTLYISSVAILENYQNRGYGTKLINTLVSAAKQQGYSRITGHFLKSSGKIMDKKGAKVLKYYENWIKPKPGAYMALKISN